MADLYNSYSSAGDPGGGRDATKFYAFDGKTHADAINANTHAQTLYGARSALPTAATGNTGALYICTDCNAEYKSDGSAWTKIRIGGYGGAPMADPPSASRSYTTLGSATFTADKDSRLLTAPSQASQNWCLEYGTLSPTSNYTATSCIELAAIPGNYFEAGIVLIDGSGKFVSFGILYSTNLNMVCRKMTNATTFSADYKTTTLADIGGQPNWFRFKDDGTNRLAQYSFNSTDWITFFSVGRTDFLTPTLIGWGADNNASGNPLLVRNRSFSM